MTDVERASDNGSDSSSEGSSSESGAELMITTRQRRKTAGNRYSQVVAQEQVDEDEQDDVALLFAEAEGEDEEYNSDEADDEADMSSSDDDDQGPSAAADDLEGEKEIQRQAKVERQKKRKADMALTTVGATRKKPKIDPTSLHRAPERLKPSKRKERVSWLPDEAAGSGRTSLRKQTVAHREVMLERLKESEEQRLKNKAIREEKEKIKQADAPKEMTQADRLAEAEKNERRNAKSLNRWEAMEARRAEEQAAKLAALKERKLNGAVITVHSSRHVYRGLKTDRFSPGPSGTDENRPKKRGPKPKGLQEQLSTPSYLPTGSFVQSPFTSIAVNNVRPQSPCPSPAPLPTPVQPKAPGSQASGDDWLAGIHEYASVQSNSGQATPQESLPTANTPQQSNQPSHEAKLVPAEQHTPNQAPSTDEQGPELSQIDVKATTESKEPGQQPVSGPIQRDDTPTQPLGPSNSETRPSPILQTTQSDVQQIQQPQPQLAPLPQVNPLPIAPYKQHVPVYTAPMDMMPAHSLLQQVQVQPPPIIEVTSTRNVVILDRFEDLVGDAKQAYSVFNNTKKQSKPTKHVGELCAITGVSAKYRDPTTGAGYASVAAFKQLKELQKHTYQWSSMLGCYVGRVGHAARGVPDGFLGRMSSTTESTRGPPGLSPSFLTIPQEIRDKIYDDVFSGATLHLAFEGFDLYNPSAARGNKIVRKQKPSIALLQVSKQVRCEAIDRFRIHLDAEYDPPSRTSAIPTRNLHLKPLMGWAVTSVRVNSFIVPQVLHTGVKFSNLKTITIDWPYSAEYNYKLNDDSNASSDYDDREDAQAALKRNFDNGCYDKDLAQQAKENKFWSYLQAFVERSGRKIQVIFICTSDVRTGSLVEDEHERITPEIGFKLDMNIEKTVERHFLEIPGLGGSTVEFAQYRCLTKGPGPCSLCERDDMLAERDTQAADGFWS
ncbi:hypothetical protein OHC33_002232 [Knufia fluminis]|uniref:Vps72/YL1 C-terminal domain-containing protein n=1 Tax=Knufia fluminis TaxID=191047 RepID=A0AAN8EV73_9EURO|nr:hypothetical protein OHC33_002232 [Knufia fluminis]